jgi:DNA-binding response OmpR family regulator
MIEDCYSECANRATVLCIDDDPQISESIALRLRSFDVEVLRAFHGTHGLWLAKRKLPELVITDMRMPQGGGNYIIQCLRQHAATRAIPIIVLTGQRNPQLEATARQLGINDFLTKPVQFAELRAAIQKIIPLREDIRPRCDCAVERRAIEP